MLTTDTTYTHRLQVLLVLAFFASLTLILHAVGFNFSLYWVYWWYDIVVHFLAGISIGLLFSFLLKKKYRPALYLFVFLSIIAWEIFEIGIGINTAGMQYLADTVIDVIVGFFGAILVGELCFWYKSSQR